jgi:O-antigen ligase
MIFLSAIPMALLFAIAVYLAINRPSWLLLSYLIAVPLFPPLPVGPIEVSMLDILAIPAFIRILLNMSRSGFVLKGDLPRAFFLIIIAAAISFFSFTFQTMIFSGQIFMRLIRLIEIFLPAVLAYQTMYNYRRDKIIRAFLIGTGLTASVAIFMFLKGISLRDSQTFVEAGMEIYRAGGTHGGSGSLGNLMGIGVLVPIWVLIHYNRQGLTKWALVSGSLSLLALLLTLSRGGLILAALGSVILLIPLLMRPAKFMKVTVVAAILVLIGSFIASRFLNTELIALAASDFQERVSGLTGLTSDFESVSSHRNIQWEQGLALYKSSALAWPFGLGYKTLKLHYDTLPDNNFNQALFEMGIFGLGALLIFIFTGLRNGFRRLHSSTALGILTIALWLGLISNMVSADVITYWHNIPAVMILLIFVSEHAGVKQIKGFYHERTKQQTA